MKLNYPIHRFSSGRILLVALAILFAFCVGAANAASEPGTVTIVLTGEPVNLDPGESSRAIEGQVMLQNITETLAELNVTDSSMMPRLAHSWKQIDANTWHFFLRKGVKFHDGEDFNAEAVIFNIKRLYDKRLINRTRDKFFSHFKLEGRALDSHTLELKTSSFQPLLPNLIGMLAICSPNTPMDKLTRNPIGTGPYRFVRWDVSTQIILERFDRYWGTQPQVKKAVYIWRHESSVRAAMVLLGEADLTPNISQQDATRPDMDKSYLNSETTLVRFGGAWDPPLSDKRVRMALRYAIDRDVMRGGIMSKDALPATHMVVPSTFGYNPGLKPWPYDPQKARQLLDEARKDGVPVDKEILFVGRTGYFPGSDDLTQALMNMFQAVGFNVKLKMVESAHSRVYENIPFAPGVFIKLSTHDNRNGDAAFTVTFRYRCQGIQSSICDKPLDDLIDKAQVAMGEERRTLWHAAFRRIHEEIIPDVMLFHMVSYARVGKRVSFTPSMATSGEMQLAHITFK